MSFNSKLQTALSVVFILTTAGAISVTAQTVADNSSTGTIAKAISTNDPKETEGTKPPTVVSENTAPYNTPANNRAGGHASVLAAKTPVNAPATQPVEPSPQSPAADQWQFQFTPYLWIAGISGTASIGNLTSHVSSGIADTSVHINFGFMSTFEAHKNKLTILTDLQYSNLGTDNGTPGPGFSGVETTTKTFVLDPEVGYRFSENKEKGRFAEVLGGIRYWHVSENLKFFPGILAGREVSASRDWVDAVVGLRGKAAISKKWFVTGKGDLGAGGSKFTYQLFGGIGVMVAKKVAIIGGYRDLYVDKSANDFTFKMSLHGPILGVGFKF